ncbi:hypothetical protein NQ318_011765 [Aromia moschata]|uniref:Uncharacterized protein n=1 Tax=Aromia moschata TaxID=1265417 RepID=A0AAV8Y1G3_9CUCU|nr:hypothetical protein NQ318_011765 [Aromia moschata]
MYIKLQFTANVSHCEQLVDSYATLSDLVTAFLECICSRTHEMLFIDYITGTWKLTLLIQKYSHYEFIKKSECCVAETVRKLRTFFVRNDDPSAPGVRKFVKLACLWITEVIHVLVRCAQLKELLVLPKVCVKTQEPQLVIEHNLVLILQQSYKQNSTYSSIAFVKPYTKDIPKAISRNFDFIFLQTDGILDYTKNKYFVKLKSLLTSKLLNGSMQQCTLLERFCYHRYKDSCHKNKVQGTSLEPDISVGGYEKKEEELVLFLPPLYALVILPHIYRTP